jgi:antibiotic biosynthesis monooxygenase (ABM) superfamily enzyme
MIIETPFPDKRRGFVFSVKIKKSSYIPTCKGAGGGKMAVKILIKRKVPADKAKKFHALTIQIRAFCLKQPGYISGESLKNRSRPNEYLVISTWSSLDTLDAWLESKERAEIQAQIDSLLETNTEYDIYEYL